MRISDWSSDVCSSDLHVTMSYDIDAEKMVQVLRIGREKLSDKGTTSAKKRVDPLRSQTGLARDTIIERMLQTFRSLAPLAPVQIGRASGRERVWQYV